jgi:hypothetical protein
MTVKHRKVSTIALIGLLSLTLVLATGCGVLAERDDLNKAVAASRDAGLQPHWLGSDFAVEGIEVEVGEGTFLDRNADLGAPYFSLTYWVTAGGSGRAKVLTFSEGLGGWDVILDGAATLKGTSVTEDNVGEWEGELWIVPHGRRTMNTVMYLLSRKGVVVLAIAKAGTTGQVDTDVNPLIQPGLLRKVVEEYLQPYPD